MFSRRDLLIGGLAAPVLAAPIPAPARGARPRLIVQITMDQLRYDLLERWRPNFRAGLRRLLDGGCWIRQGEVAHALTNSIPGHTTLASGLHPSGHGLTANEWWVERDGVWKEMDAYYDPAFPMAGHPDRPGGSLRFMKGSCLADWVKAADPRAKAVALSTGSTVAMCYGGRSADAVYWFDGRANAFVTSSFYRTGHAWLTDFNARTLKDFQPQSWTLAEPRLAGLSLPDASAWENDGRNNTFPHDYLRESQRGSGEKPLAYGQWFAGTPFKEDALFALAARAVEAEALGGRGCLDYLAVLVDSTDAIGHGFGPLSLEQLDNLVRLDRALGRFLEMLDRKLGRDGYVLALSADHGTADPPEASGVGRRLKAAEIEAALDRVAAAVQHRPGSPGAVADAAADALRACDFIADAYTQAALATPSADPFVELFRRSFRPDLTYDFPLWSDRPRPFHPARYGVVARLKEGAVPPYAASVHGSPYSYDRRVPIVLYGSGVRRRETQTGGRTVDVAPTLAQLAGIAAPAGLDGRPLEAVMA
jgi:predicted AlkP superfamily pyrophosphatase or phosphodiesterase